MSEQQRLSIALLGMRLTVFLVMFMWTLDKFLRPGHAAGVYEKFYGIAGLGPAMVYAIGVLEMLLLAAFVVGFRRRFSYGLVLVLHAVSTLSSYKQYFAPFEGPNLLFFAAWPMLAAALALYLLRERDTLLSLPAR